MQWLKKHIGGESSPASQPFMIGSDKWMGSTAQQKENNNGRYESPEYASGNPNSYPSNRKGMARSQSLQGDSSNPYVSHGPAVTQYTAESGARNTERPVQLPRRNSTMSSLGEEQNGAEAESVETSEEVLVRIPGAMVHLIDEQESPHLGSGDFSVVRINQQGNGIVALVRVGENLQWPLVKDEPTVKLDPSHYFFTFRAPPAGLEREDSVSAREETGSAGSANNGSETLSYGVTFPVSGHEGALAELDRLLVQYSCFSSPTLVHGDKQKEEMVGGDQRVPSADGGRSGKFGGMVVPEEVVSSDGKKISEQNQADFWTTMAPNVDDYGTSMARGIAMGTGHIIRGIFWVRDSTVAQLENGSIYMKSKMKSRDKPSQISPRTLRNLSRARSMSRATEKLAGSVLSGVVRTTGFFSGAVISSKTGKKFFKLLPGEVALVSLDAFGKLFDAVEKAGTDIMQSSSLMTQNVVSHRYGEEAGKVSEETMATAGHAFATAWTISKLRKALQPGKNGLSKTGLIKSAAKAAIGAGKGK